MAKKVIIIRSAKKRAPLEPAENIDITTVPEGAVSHSSAIPASKEAAKEPEAPKEEKAVSAPSLKESPKAPAKAKGFSVPWLVLFAVLFGFLAVLVGASSVSPLYAGIQFGVNETDPSYFLYMGFSLNNGTVPYLGLYDQKGMYVYSFQALGYLIGGRMGTFALLCLFASIVSFSFMFTVREYGAGKLGQLFVGVFHMALIMAFKYGNHTGDLLMPWVILPIMFYLIGLRKNQSRYFLIGSFFAGVQAAFGLASRPTEAIWAVSFVTFYFIYWLRHERHLNLLWNALIAILGLAIPLGSYCLAAYKGGYFQEMYFATVTQNFAYVGNHVYGVTLADQIITAVGVVFFMALFFPIKKKRGLDIAIFFLVMAILAGGVNIYIARFPHYWLTGIPAMVLALFFAFAPVEEGALLARGKKWYKGIIIFFSAASLVMGVIWTGMYYGMDKPLGLINQGEFSSTYRENKRTEANLDKYIRSSPTFEEDTVFALDGRGAALLYLGKLTENRFACYTSWQSEDNPKIEPEVLSYLTGASAPDWIIVSNDKIEDTLPSFKKVLSDDYTLVCDSTEDRYLTIYEANAHIA